MNSELLPLERKLTFQLSVATLARLIINTSRRFAYAFASALSQGLGVRPAAIISLIAVSLSTW